MDSNNLNKRHLNILVAVDYTLTKLNVEKLSKLNSAAPVAYFVPKKFLWFFSGKPVLLRPDFKVKKV